MRGVDEHERVSRPWVVAACCATALLGACADEASGSVDETDPIDSVVGIEVEGCGPTVAQGSGVVVDDDVVLTSAHVLRGATSIVVVWPDGRTEDADIVGFDPETDLAYLATPTDDAPHLPVTSGHVDDGDDGVAWVVRDGEAVAIDVGIRRRIRLDTEDIYVDAEVERPAWDLDATIVPGDSGGPVIVDGSVVGVLWARSSREPGRAYAIDPDRGGERIERQRRDGELGPDIDLTRCP